MGIQQGILENPNDLAINIAINLPLCLAFLLTAKKGASKLFWGGSLVFMHWGVVATYSRSGLIATVVTIAICAWVLRSTSAQRSVSFWRAGCERTLAKSLT